MILLFSTIFLYAAIGYCTLINRTIDDELGDSVTGAKPTYLPGGTWKQGTACSICHISSVVNDLSQTFDRTWHDTTHIVGLDEGKSMQATFNGKAVYVFNLIANVVPFTLTVTHLNFYIDGEYVGQYVHAPDLRRGARQVLYRVPVYVNESLESSEHTILMRAEGLESSLVLFDYIVYTTDSDSDGESDPFSTQDPGSTPSGTNMISMPTDPHIVDTPYHRPTYIHLYSSALRFAQILQSTQLNQLVSSSPSSQWIYHRDHRRLYCRSFPTTPC